mmetsp:Transcript_30306/g.78438  ORF Transcript_30306/g.78438 Transcript_30306/m.78438 type:complete len:217 (+) Transcript_30306:1777-2427(+)
MAADASLEAAISSTFSSFSEPKPALASLAPPPRSSEPMPLPEKKSEPSPSSSAGATSSISFFFVGALSRVGTASADAGLGISLMSKPSWTRMLLRESLSPTAAIMFHTIALFSSSAILQSAAEFAQKFFTSSWLRASFKLAVRPSSSLSTSARRITFTCVSGFLFCPWGTCARGALPNDTTFPPKPKATPACFCSQRACRVLFPVLAPKQRGSEME